MLDLSTLHVSILSTYLDIGNWHCTGITLSLTRRDKLRASRFDYIDIDGAAEQCFHLCDCETDAPRRVAFDRDAVRNNTAK